jgi:hypothetical protein
MKEKNRSSIPLLKLLFLIFLFSHPLFSQTKIYISHIGDTPVRDREISINEKEDVAGLITFHKKDSSEFLLQLAWRRVGEDTWWIHKQTIPVNHSTVKTFDWKFLAVPLGTDFDYKKGLELIAFVVTKAEPLPEGIIDYQSLLYLSDAVSNQVTVIRNPKNPSLQLIRPRVRIEQIAGQPFRPGAKHEVGLQAILYGEVRKPTAGLLRLVVQPLSREEHRVIDSEPLIRQGFWSAKIDFTEYGFDQESEFIIFAVITRQELPRGRGIPLREWNTYLQSHIINTSLPLRAIRVDIPLAKNQAGVKILSIDNTSVDGQTPRRVKSRCGVKGMLLGRPLNKGESVWVLATNDYEEEKWRVLGKASIKTGRYWELAPQALGGSGEYLRVLAVIAENKAESLNMKDIEENIAFSPPVRVVTYDQPPLQVAINTIDKQSIHPGREMMAYQVAGIEGTVSGRPLEADDKVWILKI